MDLRLKIQLATVLFFQGIFGTQQNPEIQAIQKLRPLVESVLTQGYMHEDRFLVQFLQAAHLDVDRASGNIKESMKWRVENNIDNIIFEDNPLDKELPYKFASDRTGRPVILIRAGETDVRKAVITGKRHLATRSGWKLVEKVGFRARSLNQSQVVAVIDLNGFSYKRHACRDCIGFGQEMGQSIEANYPGMAAAIFFINTPRVFEVVLSFMKAVLSDSTKGTLHVYGFDKAEWSEALSYWISPTELNSLFGYGLTSGKIPSPNEIRHHARQHWKDFEDYVPPERDLQAQKYLGNSSSSITITFVLTCIPLFSSWSQTFY